MRMFSLLTGSIQIIALSASCHVLADGSSGSVNIGLLPDTQGGGYNVAIHPMKAVLDKLEARGVDIVIPVGDLTDNGSTHEFEQWVGVASEYRERGIEFLPVMGNHEDSFAYTVEWIEFMKDYIPEDAVHMRGTEYVNYYVIRGNVLIVALRYYHLPVAFEWLRNVVDEHRDQIDHIVVASHDGLIGAKYGQTRENIVEGVRGSDRLMEQWDEIRHFLARHDVTWVQGHEHMYQRSVIKAPLGIEPESWRPADGNYRLPQYTQIIAGNASYKGYEFRYGERELVQSIIQHKMNTMREGSTVYDANASILRFSDQRMDYESWFTEHTVTGNDDGAKELANPDWQMLDRFSRTTDRCERLVYANSIPEGTRPVLVLDPHYRSNACRGPDGSRVQLLGGINNTFNRVDSTAETLTWREGLSRANSQNDLMRLAWQYLFQFHQRWNPNLNGNNRIVPDPDNPGRVLVPATTIDMKEHVTLSWLPAEPQTASSVMVISGTQNQTGTYSSAWGDHKDIRKDAGLSGSQPDGSAKSPVTPPVTASLNWNLATAVSDLYAVAFDAPLGTDPVSVVPGVRIDNRWVPMIDRDCLIKAAYDPKFIDSRPRVPEHCSAMPLAGRDSENNGQWWLLLNADVEIALLPVSR